MPDLRSAHDVRGGRGTSKGKQHEPIVAQLDTPSPKPKGTSCHSTFAPLAARNIRTARGRARNAGSVKRSGNTCRRTDRPGPRLLSCRKDRKSTRLNSSHLGISYAVFCLKKKNN